MRPQAVRHSFPRFSVLFVTLCLLGIQVARAQETAELQGSVSFSAADSLIIRFDSGVAELGRLVGDARVTYTDVTLSAHFIDIFFERQELSASGMATDSGMVGQPSFTQGDDQLDGAQLSYNMSTGRGRIVSARTQFEEGFIQAGVAKVREDSSVYIRDGLYTTCNCGPEETPSYSLRARKMKVVDQKWVYTGPIQLYIFNIPMPVWLPFGFLPYQEGRRSGPLAPEYGEDQRGFYLRNWGWYFAINDYMDLQLRGGIWTKGSWQLSPSYRYVRRDRYRGALSVDYLRERSGEKDDPDLVVRNNTNFRWTHSQTLSPQARLTANVNLTSSSYLRTVSERYDDNVRQSVGSSIQFNRSFRGGRTLAVNLRQNQILSSGNTDLTLPEMTFAQRTKNPFKRTGGSRNPRWYERLQYSINSRMRNDFNFRPLTDAQLIANGDTLADGRPIDYSWYEALLDGDKYAAMTGREESRIGFTARHRVPIAAPFDVRRLPLLGQIQLNVSPNANYSEAWYIETERQMLDSLGTVRRSTAGGFFALRQFDMGASANTTIYGLFPVKVGPFEGLRHTVRPRLGFTFRPDFGSNSWGYTRELLDAQGVPVVDTLATGQVMPRRYGVVSGVLQGLQQAVHFGIDNTFETKRVRIDSTGEDDRSVLKLFTVNLSSSYNFAADSLRMAPIRVQARSNILGKLNLNFSATLSPYALSSDGRRIINDYVLSLRRLTLARLTQLSVRGSMQLRGRMRSRESVQQAEPDFDEFSGAPSTLGISSPYSPYSGARGPENWSMNVSFTYQLARPRVTLMRSATVNTGFQFGLTRTWRVAGQTGYDFERWKIVATSLNLSKEFECWDMSFSWIPFGSFQSWGFDLHVKSGRLSEFLRLRQPKAERSRRFGL